MGPRRYIIYNLVAVGGRFLADWVRGCVLGLEEGARDGHGVAIGRFQSVIFYLAELRQRRTLLDTEPKGPLPSAK